ncbi:hypothetical protein [Cerasicoccus frondis]|uniref:hypothetical protein n=1 Tax=Cerasicoccus frondis TaxID=490090 RepID=UPI002852A415|nr:hypothetical protein [Cerasicoccus frondis]
MKISKQLYHAGILGRQRTGPTDWEFDQVRRPIGRQDLPFLQGATREEPSIKVSARGWRVLAHVLHLR